MIRALLRAGLIFLLTLSQLLIPPSLGHVENPLSAFAVSPPTIDGVLSAGEWDSAAQVLVFSGAGLNGTFYVMNDATNIYLALTVADPTLSANDIMEVRFDKAHNGVHDENDDSVQAKPGVFLDRYFHFTGNLTFGSFGNLDPLQNGSSAATGNGAANFFEISHPLNSGDIRDIAASPGDTLGFCLTYFKEGTATPSTMYPTNCLTADVNLGINEQQLYGDIIIAVAPVPVTITVIRFIQVENPDGDLTGNGDYYADVSIGGLPFENNKALGFFNSSDLSPFWTFTRQVDPLPGTIPIDIRILDADCEAVPITCLFPLVPGDKFPDDIMDLNPVNGTTTLSLSLDLASCTWTGPIGGMGASIGFSQGDGDHEFFGADDGGHAGSILFDIACASDGDLDDDGIPDGVERFGVRDANGNIDADMASLGADPCRPTVAVEVDYMVGVDHTHRPDSAAVAEVVAAFDDAPVLGLSTACPYAGFPANARTSGINLIVDVSTGAIPEQEAVTFDSGFESIRDAEFSQARIPYFRYSLWAHNLASGSSVSGIAELGGNELIVSLGLWTDGTGTVREQSGTFMHELGHTLGLDHGGVDEVNFKPNHLSVMSYAFQTVGIVSEGGIGTVDFSRTELAALNELALNEEAGVGGSSVLTKWFCPDTSSRSGRADGGLDWNCSGTTEDASATVMEDLNGDRVCVLPGENGELNSSPDPGDRVVGQSIHDGPDRTCDSTTMEDDVEVREVGSVQPNLLLGSDDWGRIELIFRDDPLNFEPGHSKLPKGHSKLPKGVELTFEEAQVIEAFWRGVSVLQTADFFTDADTNPLPVDTEGKPKVDVVLANGRVAATTPGEVLAWSEVKSTAGAPVKSLSLIQILPMDWTAHPPWLPAQGAIHVYFEFNNGTRIEITDHASIVTTTANPEKVLMSVADVPSAAGKPLETGESILLSTKIAYALKGTAQSGQSYPRIYTERSAATGFSSESLEGAAFFSQTGGATFAAVARLLGDVNGDFAVDIIDAALLAYSYDSKPGEPRWYEGADLDRNGRVDILDAAAVGVYFGTKA